MNKYIVSLVLAKIIPKGIGNTEPQVSIQNEVYVLAAESAQDAYERCKVRGKLKHPDHNIVVKVIVEMNEALAEDIN